MEEADGFIFGSPNHGRTISAAMTNFIAAHDAAAKDVCGKG